MQDIIQFWPKLWRVLMASIANEAEVAHHAESQPSQRSWPFQPWIIAVECVEDEGRREGVFIPRRDTNSWRSRSFLAFSPAAFGRVLAVGKIIQVTGISHTGKRFRPTQPFWSNRIADWPLRNVAVLVASDLPVWITDNARLDTEHPRSWLLPLVGLLSLRRRLSVR